MARIREGDTGRTTNMRIPLYKEELKQVQPGHMNWFLLKADIKALEILLKGAAEKEILGKCEAIHDRIDAWIGDYDRRNPTKRLAVLGFEYHWTLLRTWVPLQIRLAVEQVLSDRGGDWARLVTGFRPISRRKLVP